MSRKEYAQFFCPYCSAWLFEDGCVHPEGHHKSMDEPDERTPDQFRIVTVLGTGEEVISPNTPMDLEECQKYMREVYPLIDTDDRIFIIRNDPKVGLGSCTTMDEGIMDCELLELLNEAKIETPSDALKWAYNYECLQLEKGTNQRWGEDDDPQLIAYNEFTNE
tara:strand:- start:177 stop:668 length:492 start_codon:yes stop_codon:yes gene_type:complete